MFRFFYSVVWQLIEVFLPFTGLFNKKIRTGNSGRRNAISSLKKWQLSLPNKSQIIWFHCASLGEFEQGRPVMEALKKQHPNLLIALTFFSPSGYEVRKNYSGADWIGYLPLDTFFNARKFVNILRPNQAFFVKYEFWMNYFLQLKKNKTKLFCISVILREDQRFFKWHGFVWKPTLKAVTHFFVQNQSTLQLLNKINFSNVEISGDTRFDRVIEIAKSPLELPWISSFKKNNFLVVLGSSYTDEESLMAMLLQRVNDIKICVVPHEIHSGRIKESMARFEKFGAAQLSSFQSEKNNESRVLVVDSIGMLSSIYAEADAVVLGGGFGRGLHNSLEIAVYGIPMAFGPNHIKFQEAVDLVKIGAAFSIETLEELSSFVEHCRHENVIPNMGKKYVEDHAGATSVILDGIEKYSA
ncbi:MAG: 3-deoxy-D-manno-octulosonic acid transferase [Sediminibacterium sp.]